MDNNKVSETALPVIILLAGGLLRLLILLKGPVHLIDWWVMIDDAFYSLQTAKNIILGIGISSDGIHLTNAFQPLYIIILLPVFYFFKSSLLAPVSIALAITSLFNLFSGYFIYKIVRKIFGFHGALFSLFIWSFSFSVIKFGFNGLETSIFVFFLSFSSFYYLEKEEEISAGKTKEIILFGILLGFTLLSRLDGVFFIAGIYICEIKKFLNKDKKDFLSGVKTLLSPAIALLIVSPYLLRSLFVFGTLIPSSGKAARLISMYNGIRPYFTATNSKTVYFPVDSFPPFAFFLEHIKGTLMVVKHYAFALYPFDSISKAILSLFGKSKSGAFAYLLFIVICALFAFFTFFFKRRGPAKNLNYIQDLGRFNFLLIFALFILLNYTFYIFGQWHYFRYYFPVCMVITIYSGAFFDYFLKALPGKRKGLVSGIRKLIMAVIIFYFLFSFMKSRTLNNYGYLDYLNPPPAVSFYYETAQWIDKNIPESAKIGGFETGIVNYFTPNHKIINLDGPQNADTLKALEDGRVMEYIRKEKIEYIFGQGIIIKNQLFRASKTPPKDGELELIWPHGRVNDTMLVYKVNAG